MSDFLCGANASGPKLLAKDFLPQYAGCCIGSAMRGARACTCWIPEFDRPQQRIRPYLEPPTRSTMCVDCAYKPDSPELTADPYALEGMDTFWCHQGIRRPLTWIHPDGRVREAYPGDYQPPIEGAVPYRADGLPASRCGGWAAVRRAEAV